MNLDLQTEQIGIIGATLTALTLIVRRLLDFIENKDKRQNVIEQITLKEIQVQIDIIQKDIVSIGSHVEDIEDAQQSIQRVVIQVKEILRLHRDPNNRQSTEDTNRMLNTILISLGEIRGELRAKGAP
jgi:hypothetical protein